MSAGVYNLTIEQGATYSTAFTYKDSAGAAINLTGYTITSELKRKISDSSPIMAFTCTVTNAANGQFSIALTAAQTALLPTFPNSSADKNLLPLYYDIIATSGATVIRILEGIAYISPRIT